MLACMAAINTLLRCYLQMQSSHLSRSSPFISSIAEENKHKKLWGNVQGDGKAEACHGRGRN